ITSLINNTNALQDLWRFVAYTPLLFFAFIMLTEPQTTPPARSMRIIYGGLVGLLFAPAFHFGPFYSSPEIGLVIGNIFSYLVSPKEKLILKLKEMKEIAHETYNFVFTPNMEFAFKP